MTGRRRVRPVNGRRPPAVARPVCGPVDANGLDWFCDPGRCDLGPSQCPVAVLIAAAADCCVVCGISGDTVELIGIDGLCSPCRKVL